MKLASRSHRSMQWVEAGAPAFLGDAGKGPEGRPVEVNSVEAFDSIFRQREEGAVSLRRTLRSYFDYGGRRCYVVHLPKVDVVPEGRAAALLHGDDGGPGFRSGLNSLSDFEDVGTVAAPGLTAPLCLGTLIAYARRRPSKSLLIEGPRGSQFPLELYSKFQYRDDTPNKAPRVDLLDRLVWLAGDRHADAPVDPAGAALGMLESTDFDPGRGLLYDVGECRGSVSTSAARALLPEGLLSEVGAGLRTVGERFGSLRVWRRWEGLRRSIERGTRWVLFELQDEYLKPRLARELNGFLYHLFEAGLFAGRVASEAFDVRCDSNVKEVGGAVHGCLRLQVKVKLRGDGGRGEIVEVWTERDVGQR